MKSKNTRRATVLLVDPVPVRPDDVNSGRTRYFLRPFASTTQLAERRIVARRQEYRVWHRRDKCWSPWKRRHTRTMGISATPTGSMSIEFLTMTREEYSERLLMLLNERDTARSRVRRRRSV